VGRTATLAVLAACASVSAEAVEITGAKQFEKKVFGKKNRAAFVKFLAPW